MIFRQSSAKSSYVINVLHLLVKVKLVEVSLFCCNFEMSGLRILPCMCTLTDELVVKYAVKSFNVSTSILRSNFSNFKVELCNFQGKTFETLILVKAWTNLCIKNFSKNIIILQICINNYIPIAYSLPYLERWKIYHVDHDHFASRIELPR